MNDMFDPRIGIKLPPHLRTQARIIEALNTSKNWD